ncbi:MAG: putative bifunctional diguanylate cyclase/phosphodiesterase [Hyphomicrobium sp.]
MTGTYSPELVGLSLLVAIAASYVAFALAAHIATTRGWAGAYWLAGGAVAMGLGIWSMHFIGMLAFQLPIPMSYDLITTTASLVIAIIVSAFALYLVSRHEPTPLSLAIGAVAMGSGIALMHYTGMAAMNTSPPITYDHALVAVSIALAIAASGLALSLAFRLRGDVATRTILRRLLGAIAMGIGICTMHYTGMAAAQFAPGTICTGPGLQIDQHTLAIAVAAATFVFLGVTMLVLTIDVRLAHQIDEANAQIAAMAREDSLTGLANRRTFLEHLDRAFGAFGRTKAEFAVFIVDLDGFKEINDTLGHAAGDSLIVEIARRLKEAVRRDDMVARFGGDEFAILQTNIANPSDIGTLAEKICAAVAEVHTIGHDEVAVTASIGIAKVSSDTPSTSDLMVQADLALYRAKDDGRNRYRVHDADLDQQVHLRTMLARELKSAMTRGELELLYAPQMHIATGCIVGLEARVRWNHPARGVIRPEVFIPVAERAGMIRAVGDWVIEEACAQLSRWKANGIAPPILALDVFGGQLKVAGDIGDEMKTRLDKYGIDAGCIELEFDESVLAQSLQRHPAVLETLRQKGFRFAIADFGSGLSAIGCLAETPVQRLKISKDMVARALSDSSSAKAVRMVVSIGREVGAEIIADGVATQAQATFLLAAGCEQAQGPFFGPLLSAMEATLLLRDARIDRGPSRLRKSSAA